MEKRAIAKIKGSVCNIPLKQQIYLQILANIYLPRPADSNGLIVVKLEQDRKGYLHYRAVTSQNMSSKVQVKNFFILQKNYVPFSRYSSFCSFNHTMFYQICDVMMSIST